MAADDIDRYFADLEEPKRTSLEEMRRRILEVIPEAEQGLSYAVPAFKVDGRVVAGLAVDGRGTGVDKLTAPGNRDDDVPGVARAHDDAEPEAVGRIGLVPVDSRPGLEVG